MSRIPKPHEIYKHFKGNLYQILAIAEHSETGEKLVVYQALYGSFQIYARPLDSFLEKVDRVKYPDAGQMYRFELQGGAQPVNQTMERAKTEHISDGTEPGCITDMAESGCTTDGTIPGYTADRAESKSTADRVENEPEEELNIDPMVLRFLEADTYEERLEILMGLKSRITDEMITTMAIACDVEVPEGSLQNRFEGLRNCLATLDKYECNRLR